MAGAVLPIYSKAYGHTSRKSTLLPSRLRVRYLVLLAIVLSIWYFTFLRSDELPAEITRYTGIELPKPLHTVHEIDEDAVANADPLWNPKVPTAEEVPPNPVDQKKQDDLAAAALLNTHPDEQSGSIETVPEPPAAVSELDTGETVPQNEPEVPGKAAMNEDLAEITRVHDSADTTSQLENKPIDDALLDSLKKIESAYAGTAASSPQAEDNKVSTDTTASVPAAAKAGQAVEDENSAAAKLAEAAKQPLEDSAENPVTTAEVASGDKTAAKPVAEAPIDTTTTLKTTTANTTPFKPPPGGPWDEFSFIFAFGDSWTYTAFDIGGPAPSPQNPLGNPPLPQNGTSHPPSWLHYLSLTYNTTYIRTYNIARGAATIDRDVVMPHPGFLYTWTFKEQAADAFGLAYSGHPAPVAPWKSSNALFAVWFGVVDIALLMERKEWSVDVNVANVAAYGRSLETLYAFGARRFLLLTVPPIDLMPGVTDTVLSQQAVSDFNTRLSALRSTFLTTHADAEIALFDLNALLTSIIADPATTLQTSGLKNTTDVCGNYNPDANAESMPWDRFDEECGVRYDEYFWANTLHPTFPVHDAIAAGVVGDCYGPGGKKGFCS